MGPAARINVELGEVFFNLICHEFCLGEKRFWKKQ